MLNNYSNLLVISGIIFNKEISLDDFSIKDNEVYLNGVMIRPENVHYNEVVMDSYIITVDVNTIFKQLDFKLNVLYNNYYKNSKILEKIKLKLLIAKNMSFSYLMNKEKENLINALYYICDIHKFIESFE